jgi:hypothetical protein
MGRTVVEPVRVSVWAEEADPVCVAAALVEAVDVDPLLVHPATRSDTKSNAARHAVTKRYELRWVFMVFVHEILPGSYTVFRHRI